MFSGNNLLILLMCVMPALLYSLLIYFHAPENAIKKKVSITYLYTGLLSTTILTFIFLLLPNIHKELFNEWKGTMMVGGKICEIYQRTTTTLLSLAFLQIALVEELCKFTAFKLSDYSRGKKKKNLDNPYAIMFYCALISGSFSIMENIDYVYRTASGEFGMAISPIEVLCMRAGTSVVLHMVAGLFMGYFIALAKGKGLIKKWLFNIVGILTATIAHGLYDFLLMRPDMQKESVYVTENISIHPPTIILLIIYTFLAYLAANDLKKKSEVVAIN